MGGESEPEWRYHAAIAAILILDALVLGLSPKGPWDDTGFSRGAIGLLGMSLAYVAWYRATFKRKGLIPWLDLWEDPARSAKIEMIVAALVLALAWAAGSPLQPHLPDLQRHQPRIQPHKSRLQPHQNCRWCFCTVTSILGRGGCA